ncbi:MAG: cytochrome c [Immundisolibacterales bacterium]|nr:cytochrome c [Immundisolibacterales bacterium]
MSRPRPRRPAARMLAIGAAAIVIAIGAGVTWHLSRSAAPARADASDPELVALGAAVYEEHCASCHGRNLEGEPDWRRRRADGTLPSPPHDATGHTWHHPDEHLFRMTREGPAAVVGRGYRSTMPGFAGVLDDREIWASLAYIKSRWPADIQAAQSRIDAGARE